MIDTKIMEQIPIIREDAAQLLNLANEIVSSRRGPYEINDYLGMMADIFLHKQIGHLRSICILVDANQTPDALIIARSAFENMILLMWAAYGPPRKNLPRQWFLYEIKEGYFNKDQDLDPENQKWRIQNVKDYEDIILTPRGKEKLHLSKTLLDSDFTVNKLPSIKNMLETKWLKERILENESLKGKEYLIYQILSQLPHGTPQGMKMIFRHDGNCLSQDGPICKYLGGVAVALGVQSLIRTVYLFHEHFKLDFHDKLGKFKKEQFHE